MSDRQKDVRAALVDAGLPIDRADALAAALTSDRMLTRADLQASMEAKSALLADLTRRCDANGHIAPTKTGATP